MPWQNDEGVLAEVLLYGTSIISLLRGTQTSTNNLTATEIMRRQQSYATTSAVASARHQALTLETLQRAPAALDMLNVAPAPTIFFFTHRRGLT